MNFTLFSSTSSTYNRKEIQTDFGSNPYLYVFLAPKHTAVGFSIKKSSILSYHNSYKITLESQKHLAPDCLTPSALGIVFQPPRYQCHLVLYGNVGRE